MKPHKALGLCDKHHQLQYTANKPGYIAWIAMNQRCYNENNPWYHKYGGRGIEVCERWRSSYQNFLNDMGVKPTSKHSIDRINNDGNYEPNNCRWATQHEQVLNMGIRNDNTSGYKGVARKRNGWRAYIWLEGKQFNLGSYKTKDEAIKARISGEKEYYNI
jgi:hypothetical protein